MTLETHKPSLLEKKKTKKMEERETTFIILKGAKLIYKDENGEQSPPLLVTIASHNTSINLFYKMKLSKIN